MKYDVSKWKERKISLDLNIDPYNIDIHNLYLHT